MKIEVEKELEDVFQCMAEVGDIPLVDCTHSVTLSNTNTQTPN